MSMATEKPFGEELREWRAEHDLTQEEAAGVLEVKLNTYQEWEQGRNKPYQIDLVRKVMRLAAPRRRRKP